MEEVGFEPMEEESFMDMLRSGDEGSYLLCPPSSLPSPSSSCYSSAAAGHMLCFGVKEEEALPLIHGVLAQKSSDSSMSSLSSSPPSTTTTVTSSKTTKKKMGSGSGGGGRRTTSVDTTSTTVTTSKKPKTESSTGQGTVKVRKEKLGERIMALQQLVSPFSKTDTASVLHEALGYIRFLHDQVQVLSSPYLQRMPSPGHLQDTDGGRRHNDLRSRGLCLVPISCTEHLANNNGADLWSSTMGTSNNSKKKNHCSASSKQ